MFDKRAKAEEKEFWGGGYKFKCGINDTVTQRPGRSETINVSVIWGKSVPGKWKRRC